MPELSVILVSYNDRRNLELCLDSLSDSVRNRDVEVVVVDNNSSDGSPELVKNRFPWICLIENPLNVGFARACNQGLSRTSGLFVLFLNTDATVSAGALDLLLREIRDNPRTGGVGPALETGRGSCQVSFGKKVDFFAAFFQKAVLNPYFTWRLKSDEKNREVGWLSAACLLIRREALEEAGLFDERFFLYFEDIDLCYRIKEKGWKLIFLPRARMTHIGGTATSAQKSWSRYHYRKSQVYFYRKHNSGISLILLRLYLRLVFSFSFWLKRKGEIEEEIELKRLYDLLK